MTITIRSVPESIRDELAARAARSGRSMQEYLSAELAALASRPSASEAIARIRARAEHYPRLDGAALLNDIDADRR